jgi:hypothetical protein
MSKQVLLFEGPQGNTIAVVCNSVDAADRIRDVAKLECVGTVPVVPFSAVVLP